MPRMIIELNDKAYQMLEALQQKTGKSKAELLRQGLILRDYAERQREEGKILGIIKDGEVEQEIILT